jgi:aminopeptidase N
MTGPHVAKSHAVTYLKDYLPPDHRILTANLQFDLDEERTLVKSLLVVHANYDPDKENRPLKLDGRDLELLSVSIDGRKLGPGEFTQDEDSLTIPAVPGQFTLEVETAISPKNNTALTGLYLSGRNFCTQCEAEGFRRITYYLDRPDAMARFMTTIVGDKAKYPVLLSNGNLIDSGVLRGGKHFAKWHDPSLKPAYLFALVAGDLARIEDRFRTMSGRDVALHIYVQEHNRDKCGHAMESLKKAMRWDEETYGREYDLDLFMIVATDDFNMGAMENKGLNVFNSKYVLAKQETATDADFQGIMGVVGHEYFHNWSGDRVTCRDWFQLSLKEGFTVFRDQQFMEDMTSKGVKRISDVNILRTHQFREDSGPMAHPVRPDSYVEINNFYTLTVYNKGAEVIRMLHTLLGPARFRKGTDLYFERHDGQAVTTDDFVKALEDASGIDLAQFKRWYTQAGTPELTVSRIYDPKARTLTLTVKQTCPPTPGQQEKQPFHIPLAVGLLGPDGRDLPLKLVDAQEGLSSGVLELRNAEETFVFADVPQEPVPSLLRGFSAPVKLKMERSSDELAFLMANDLDEFNRWDACQQMAIKTVLALVRDLQAGKEPVLGSGFIDAFRKTLENTTLDHGFLAMALTLPAETYLAEFMEEIDPTAVHEARRFVVRTLASRMKDELRALYAVLQDNGPYHLDPAAVGKRSLRNVCLSYLAELDTPDVRLLCAEQFKKGSNMTDVIAALASLANLDCREREEALAEFYGKWKHDPLVMDKWLAIQAGSSLPKTLDNVKTLTTHPAFSIMNPNKVRALIGAFSANAVRFHEAGGAGYAFLADRVLQVDAMNPQIAARLASAFTTWKRFDAPRRALMKAQLERMLATPGLSKDVHEIAAKSLA